MITRSKESDIQRSILNYLRTHYPTAVTWKLHEDPIFGIIGIPDILFIYDNNVYFFEVKRQGEDATKIQKIVLEKIRHNGIIAEVVYGVLDVQQFIKGV